MVFWFNNDMAIRQAIQLNLIPNGQPVVIPISQYDRDISAGVSNQGRIVVQLMLDGEPFDVTSPGYRVDFQCTKPNGLRYIRRSLDKLSSFVYIFIQSDVTDVPGDVYCNLVLSKSGERIGTQAFIIRVQEDARGEMI